MSDEERAGSPRRSAAAPDDLGTASVYDLLYAASSKDYAIESAALHALVQERSPGASSLLDVGCGTGEHLVRLMRWYEVAGADLSPAMLAQAAMKLPGVPLFEADMRALALGRRFDAITCLFSAIGYLADEEELGRAVGAMASHLRPGGVLVIDGWVLPEAWHPDVASHVETAESSQMKVARVGIARREGRRTRLAMQYLVATDDGIRHLSEEHLLTLFERRSYLDALAGAGIVDLEVRTSPMPGRDRYVGTRRR